MDADAIRVAEQCTRASDEEGTPFPQIIAALGRAGIEQYHADLLRAERTYYMPDGSSHVVACVPVPRGFGHDFSAEGVQAAVRAAQAGAIAYPEFCMRVAAAGCTGYLVSLAGRRVVYFGRTGENVTELFPGGN